MQGNYEQLKAAIAAVIKTNGNNEITGALMQQVLRSIVSQIGLNGTFAGIATPATNPGTPDQNVFYLASESGVYPNFAGYTLEAGHIAVFANASGAWTASSIEVGSSAIGGFVALDSIADLPENPSDPHIGYIIGTHLYVYVGTGGDTLNGKYKDCGEFKGEQGEDGKSAYQSYLDTTSDNPPKTESEWVASLKGEDGAPGAPGADGVDLGEVALVQSNGMNAEKVMSQKAVTENYIELSDYYYQVIRKAYSTVNYTAGTLNSSGEVVSGPAYVTNFLPVVGGETLHVNITTTTKFAYYDAQSAFISIVTVGSGMRSYVVPVNAAYARFQVGYNSGATPLLGVREKTFANKSFYDLITSPIKTRISIGFTGDSNTVGYGLASGEKSWANLLGDALVANFATKRYGFNSPWVESMGFSPYSGTANFKTGSQMSIYTDAETITLAIPEKYSAAWKWQIDGVDSGTASSNSLTTDGMLHKITVVFTAGQSINPCFVIDKAITYTNDAYTGAGIGNMPFNTGYDWYFVMIGTNNRGSTTTNYLPQLQFKFAQQYFGKGTYVVPFPNHKSDSSYIYSQMLIYSQFAELFKEAGWDVINLAAINADAFYSDTNYQSDKIHYNANGHRIIANMVSGALGFPLYLQG